MKRNLYDVEFEDYIKKTADQYRMYPSEDVWNGIHKTLHPNKKWYGFGLGVLLIGTGIGTALVINTKKTDLKEIAGNQPVTTSISQPSITNQRAEPGISHNTASAISPGSITSNDQIILSKPVDKLNNTVPFASGLDYSINTNVLAANNLADVYEPVQPSVKITDQATDQNDYYTGPATSKEKDKTADIPTERFLITPLTIESILNAYQRRRNKVTFQVFFTPTISYRKLAENKEFIQSAPSTLPPNYTALYNINDVVTHKPDMGLEIGLNAKYSVSKNIKAKAGLQFNMSRYEIKAFNNPTEIATISLNNGRRVESVSTISNYRNFNGTKADWLKNFYFQASLPVGAEIMLTNNDKISFGVGSTIQPTYVLSDRAYLISNDYKNYSEVPWLIRRWNVNTSVETFVSYSTGKLNWQVGPQVRYQILSSFVKKYPVKENLFDFGLKVGIGLND